MHTGGPFVIYLEAIHAYVTLAGLGIAGDYAGHSDEASGIFRPALQNGKVEYGEVVTVDDFFAWSGGNGFGEELAHFRQHGKHLHFVEEPLWGFQIHEMAYAVGDFVERVHPEGKIHAPRRTELVDQYLRAGMTFNILEQECWTASFADAISDFCDLEDRTHRRANCFQFARTLERCHPVTQIFVSQRFLPSRNAELYCTASC